MRAHTDVVGLSQLFKIKNTKAAFIVLKAALSIEWYEKKKTGWKIDELYGFNPVEPFFSSVSNLVHSFLFFFFPFFSHNFND